MNIRCQANDSQFKQWAGYMAILQSGVRVANFPPCVRYDSEYEKVVTYPLYEIDTKEDDELKALKEFFSAERFDVSGSEEDYFWLDDCSEEDEKQLSRLRYASVDDLSEEDLTFGLDCLWILDYAFFDLETVDEHEVVIKREKCVAYTKWE